MGPRNRASESVPMLQGSRDEFRAEKSTDFEIEALHALADALLQLGRTQEATSAVHDANALISEVPDPLTRLDMSMVSARLAAALGKPADAVRSLQSVAAEARKRGAVVAEFDARLAEGEIEVASPQRKVGEGRLRSLQKDAQARGFLLTARKAGVALDARH